MKLTNSSAILLQRHLMNSGLSRDCWNNSLPIAFCFNGVSNLSLSVENMEWSSVASIFPIDQDKQTPLFLFIKWLVKVVKAESNWDSTEYVVFNWTGLIGTRVMYASFFLFKQHNKTLWSSKCNISPIFLFTNRK